MAVAIKGEKLFQGPKGSTKVTEYTSGAPVAPDTGYLAIYLDLGDADEHRAVEIANKLTTLFDRARESNYLKPTATTLYFRVPLNGSKFDIEATTTSTDIVEGDVAIGIEASVRSGAHGSTLFDACFKQIKENLWEQWGSVDATPSVVVNTGGTIEEGGTLVVTSTMLRASDPDSYDPDLIFEVTSGPANGQMEYLDDPGVAITEFTQADINAGQVVYVHDDSDTLVGDFGFSVTDGTTTLTGQTFAITVTPVAD